MTPAAFDDARLLTRFWKKCMPEPNSGCWLWLGGTYNDQGYGSFWLAPTMRSAHIVAYEALVGAVPDGLVLDHLCRTTCCVNPAHLEPVTQLVNIVRGTGWSARHASQTHCLNGHELTGDNLVTWHLKRGRRACRTCRNAKINARRAAKRTAAIHNDGGN